MAAISIKEFIVQLLESAPGPLSTVQIYEFFGAAGYRLEKASIRGRLNSLTYEGRILRVGFGRYAAWSHQFYNLLVSGSGSAWEEGSWKIPRARYLEYTQREVADRFKPLSPDIVGQLIKLPTIFAYEAGVNKAARVGKLVDVHIGAASIDIWFKFDESWPPIEPMVLNKIKENLGYIKNEEFRTHWAVKQVNLFNELNRHGIVPYPVSGDDGSEIPDVKPAAVEPIWEDGRLVLPSISALSDVDGQTMGAALVSLRESLLELVKAAQEETNIDRRAVSRISALAEQIPDEAPLQSRLFTIAHGLEWMSAYQTRVNDEWPSVLAAQYSVVALQYERTVRQFPKWREFVRNSALDRALSQDEVTGVDTAAAQVISILREPVSGLLVDSAIPDVLETLEKGIAGGDVSLNAPVVDGGRDLLTLDLLESIDNIAKRLAEPVLKKLAASQDLKLMVSDALRQLASSASIQDGLAAYKKGFAGEFPKAMRDAGKDHARMIPGLLPAALLFLIALALSGSGVVAAGVASAVIAGRKFAWLAKLVKLIKDKTSE